MAKIKVTTIVRDTRRGAKVECRKFRDGDVAGDFDNCDVYIDEFDTEKEARKFMAEAKNA